MSEYSVSRDSQRVPLETRVQLKFEWFGGFISEYSSNISPGGMFIRTQTPEPMGRLIGFELRLGDGYELIRGTGEVVWARMIDQGPDKPAGMGIRFLEISPDGRELIYQIVDNYIAQGGTPFDVTEMPAGAPEPGGGDAPAPAPADASPLPAPGEPGEPGEPAVPAMPAAVPAEPAPVVARAELPWPAAVLEPPAAARVPAKPEPEPAPGWPEPLAPTFGAMSAEEAAPRRGSRLVFWAALGGLLALVAALAVLKQDVLLGWFLPAKRPQLATAPPAGPAPRHAAASPAPVPQSPAAAPATPAVAPVAPASPPPPQPVTALPSPAPAPVAVAAEAAVPVPSATGPGEIQKITWKQDPDGTEVVVWTDGVLRRQDWAHYRIDGDPPRELIKLYGIRHPFASTRLVAGTRQLLQVRTGYHVEPKGNELHVVLDLTGFGVEVTGIAAQGAELHIQLKGK
ncbi:MAG TPA: TIGR02266 family protein [Thermoanaerobaculia bacterium]|jgi:uncharacterized protein (TIGR02266 family)|nr:TIGR02266 family protein [Thermoanaerobaculia bacterium]